MDDRMSPFVSAYFLYEIEKEGAVILRCFSRDGSVDIPEQVEGIPVRKLGPYAFSAHAERNANVSSEALREGRIRVYPGGGNAAQLLSADGAEISGIRALCGNLLKELVLPPAMEHVGRYCFYDCESLKRLKFPGTLSDWGSGAFTGCHRIEELCVCMNPDEGSCLKQVLDELPEKLTVEFRQAGTGQDPGNARLVFPEFYEEGVENTPARILETHVHGTGIRYRNCFQGRRFDFVSYDALFPYAQAQESPSVLTEMVLARLRFPHRLEPAAGERYENYVRSHLFVFGKYFLDQKDTKGLQWYLERFAEGPLPQEKSAELLNRLSSCAVHMRDPVSQSLIMDFQRKNCSSQKRRRRLEL